MRLSTYPQLSAGLSSLAERYRSVRASRPLPSFEEIELGGAPSLPGGVEQVKKDVRDVWDHVYSSGSGAGNAKRDVEQVEIVRAEVELAGRELVLDTAYTEPSSITSTFEDKVRFLLSMYDALDITLALYEIALVPAGSTSTTAKDPSTLPRSDPGVIFIPLLEELVDLLSVESWAGLFGFLETRSERFTSDMLPSKGKALPLLKLLNTLLRSIPKSPSVIHPSSSSSAFPDSITPVTSSSTTCSTNLELRARVHIYASETFSLSDPSGVNLRGEYWAEDWSRLADREGASAIASGAGQQGMGLGPESALQEVLATRLEGGKGDTKALDGDVAMDGVEDSVEVEKRKKGTEMDQSRISLFKAISSLPAFFSNPPSIVPSTIHATRLLKHLLQKSVEFQEEETPLAIFKKLIPVVLDGLGEASKKARETGAGGVTNTGRNVGAVEGGGRVYPHHIQSPELLQSQLRSPTFRRQILVQILIFLQIIRSLDAREKSKLPKDMQFPATFIVGPEDTEWAKEKIAEIRDHLAAEEGAGREFNAMVATILGREAHYAAWKHLGCKPFEKPPLPEKMLLLADHQRKTFLTPLRPYKYAAGTAALTAMSRDPLTSVDQLLNFEIPSTVESLKAEFDRELQEEEDAKAMGQVDEKRLGPWVEEKASLSWRALRLVIHDNLEILNEVGPRGDVATLSAAIATAAATESDTGTAGGVAMSRNVSGESAGAGQSPAPQVDPAVVSDATEQALGTVSSTSGPLPETRDEDVKMETEKVEKEEEVQPADSGDVAME